MVKLHDADGQPGKELWEAGQMLISLDPDQRDQAIDRISTVEGFHDSPLVAYLLISRLAEPKIEIRFHLVQLIGSLLDFEAPGPHFSDQVLLFVHNELAHMTRDHFENLLEVSSRYLSSEGAVKNILKLCSYAGDVMGGIVNDRKQPVPIRQQAVIFCGELGLLESRIALKNLVRRVEKASKSSASRKSRKDEEQLLTFALAALSKLEV
jgi:hypothetical protein